jgi:hypothetical protein
MYYINLLPLINLFLLPIKNYFIIKKNTINDNQTILTAYYNNYWTTDKLYLHNITSSKILNPTQKEIHQAIVDKLDFTDRKFFRVNNK